MTASLEAPTVTIIIPAAFCSHCEAPVLEGQFFCSGECEAFAQAENDRYLEQLDGAGYETGTCIVCGGSTEGTRWCGVGCYQLWRN